jgi:hypothetical protein
MLCTHLPSGAGTISPFVGEVTRYGTPQTIRKTKFPATVAADKK